MTTNSATIRVIAEEIVYSHEFMNVPTVAAIISKHLASVPEQSKDGLETAIYRAVVYLGSRYDEVVKGNASNAILAAHKYLESVGVHALAHDLAAQLCTAQSPCVCGKCGLALDPLFAGTGCKCEFPASVRAECPHLHQDFPGTEINKCLDCGVSLPDGGVEAAHLPWFRDALKDWSIVGMNHYVLDTSVYYDIQTRFLYVAMTKGNQCIKAQGANQLAVWDDLERQAVALESLTPTEEK